jgi:hypothetical protein
VKVKITALLVLVVVFAISFSTSAPAAPAPNAKSTAAVTSLPAAASVPAAAVPQDHPEIREAIESLRRAKAHLMAAKHDYHGHREAAIHATDDAIRQLELCLKFD